MKIYSPATLVKTPADFTLSANIPAALFPETNVDGTRPRFSVKVEGPSQHLALQTLNYFNTEQGLENLYDNIFTELLNEDTDEVFTEESLSAKTEDEISELADALYTKVFSPFKEFKLVVDASVESPDGVVSTKQIKIVITAPSGMIALEGLLDVTTPEKLTRLATSFMPDEEDEDYDF